VGEVDSLSRKEQGRQPPVLVVSHIPYIFAPAPPSGQRHEGGCDLAAALPRESGHPQLLARYREPRQAHEIIDRVESDPDNIEHRLPPLIRSDR
jgi:hypothetical protein